jgi:hypothetical protein
MTENAIAENKRHLGRRVEEIRSNRDLNEAAKQRMISEAHDEAARRHGELVSEREEAAERERLELERSVFKLSYPKSAATERDREVYRQGYRDAAFRGWNMGASDLERVLSWAERVGDSQLAQAVYHEAVERGIDSVADSYRAVRPDAKKRWERYVAARRASESVEGMLSTALETQAPERLQER